jgi:hypothetical protein
MLYEKIKIYLSNNNINIEDVNNYFEIKDLSDGNGAFIDYWTSEKIGISQPAQEELQSISSTDSLIIKIIPQIKEEAGRRIIKAYPEWRQRNHMAAVIDIQNKELVALKSNTTYTPSADEIATITAAQTAKNQVFAIRAKSDQLEASLDSMTLAELEAFDPTHDSNWI